MCSVDAFRAALLPFAFCSPALAATRCARRIVTPLDPALAPNVPVSTKALELSLNPSSAGRSAIRSPRSRQASRCLADYRSKPLLVSFIYTSCFGLPDHRETCRRPSQYGGRARRGPLQRRQHRLQPALPSPALKAFATQNGMPPTGNSSARRRRSRRPDAGFGFNYAATPAGFDHIVQVTLVDADGKIYRQIYGEALSTDMLVEPLKQLITGAPVAQSGAVADLVDRVRILCSVYDPNTGKYRLNYVLFFEIGGFLTFAGYILWYIRRGLRQSKSA